VTHDHLLRVARIALSSPPDALCRFAAGAFSSSALQIAK
jgi:hypothetical protein